MIVSDLSQRTMSAFPISIGTSLALESIDKGPNDPYDKERIIPNTVDTQKYSELWVNLFTLFRNIYQSVSTASRDGIDPVEYKDTLLQEIDIIKDFITRHTAGKLKCVFYASDYADLKSKHPHARIRQDNTDKQKLYTDTMLKVVGGVFKHFTKEDKSIKHFKLKLEPDKATNVLLLTHYAYDLLSFKNFNTLDMLESHTGILKPKGLWYTKLTNGSSLVTIPFNQMTLQVFGDSQTFSPLNKEVRQQLIDISTRYEWNSLTSKDRVRLGIGSMKDAFTRAILLDML